MLYQAIGFLSIKICPLLFAGFDLLSAKFSVEFAIA